MSARGLLSCVIFCLQMFAGRLPANTDIGTNAPGDGIPDGLCDVWQNVFHAWGLEPLADEDGDGICNLAESIAGTDPRDAHHGFKPAIVDLVGETIRFTFLAEKGKKYRVSRFGSPGGVTWTAVPGTEFVSTRNHGSETIVIPRPLAADGEFYRLEVRENDADGDGVADWAEWRRGTDAETLAEVESEFALDASDIPIFADAFSDGSRFDLDRMFVQNGHVSGAPNENWGQITYFFDDPPDVRDGDIAVYWAFRTNAAAGAEEGKLYMYLNFTDVPVLTFPEPARIALNVRPSTWCVLYCDPGWQLPNSPELYIYPSAITFPDTQTTEKFRVIIHWVGGDHVTATPEYWDRTVGSWQPFTLRDSPNAGPYV